MKTKTFFSRMAWDASQLLRKSFTSLKALTLLFAVGLSVNVWGAIADGTYVLCTSTSDLKAGEHYIIASGTSNKVQCISNVESTNNRNCVEATVSESKITVASNSTIMTLTLGGATGAWTFYTDNYSGTNGYFDQGNQTSKNYLKIDAKATAIHFTISFGTNNNAIITNTEKTSRNILRYNSGNNPPIFSCYSSGQSDIYLYKKASNSVLEKIELSGQTTKYRVGDTFSFDGTCTATYDDGETKTVKGTVKTAPDMTTAGNKTITISYTDNKVEKTASYDITVYAPNALVITTQATTKKFRVGDTFSSSGLAVQLTYVAESGLSNKSVSSPTISSPDMTSAGVKTIDVSYVGLSTSYDITVYAPIGLTITTQATKNKFFQNETFSSSGLKTKVNYSESSLDKEVTPTISTPTMSQLGEQTITLTYTTVETSYTINVYSVTVNTVMEHQVDGDDVTGNTAVWDVSTKKVTVGKATNYSFDKLEVDGASSSGSFSNGFTLSNPTKDVTVTATWHRLFSLTYNTEGGDPISAVTGKAYGETITLPEPTKTGYSFEGWYDNEEYNGSPLTSPYTINADATIFAKWSEILPTSFDVDVDNLTLVHDDANNRVGYIQVTFTPSTAFDRGVKFEAVKNEGGVVTVNNPGGNDPKLKITANKEGEAIYKITSKRDESLTKIINITVKRLPILTWKDANGTVVATTKATALNGGKVVLPKEADYIKTPETCDEDYDHFMGWSATPFKATTNEPNLVQDGDDVNSDSETGDKTYYAVFAKGQKGDVVSVAGGDMKNGVTDGQKTAGWTTNNVGSYSNKGVKFDGTTDYIQSPNLSSLNAKSVNVKILAGINGSSESSLTIYALDANKTELANIVISTTTDYSGDQEEFNKTLSSSTAIIAYIKVQMTKKGSNLGMKHCEIFAAATEYHDFLTSCCTPLDAPAGGTATNVTATAATISWNTVTNATGYQYKIGNGDWSTSSLATSVNLTDLTPGTQYTVYLRANGTGTNCDEGTETSFTFTTLYTITATVNNDDFGMAQVSLDNVSWSNQVAAAPGTAIHVKATNNSGYSFSAWSVEEGGAGSFDAQTSSTTFTTGAANTTIKATFLANVKVLDHITITAPTKTDYLEGDTFDPSGMTITAFYEDETSSPLLINDVTIEPNGALTPDDTKVTISYTYEGVTKTADQTITVTPVYTVNWYVNGNAVKTTERVAEGTTYASLDKPATPADNALSTCEANKFMGWATALITKDDATEADFNDIKLDETTATISKDCKEFHAVFANMTDGGNGWKKITTVADFTPGTYVFGYESTDGFIPMRKETDKTTINVNTYLRAGTTEGSSSATTLTLTASTDVSAYTITVGTGSVNGTITIHNGTNYIGVGSSSGNIHNEEISEDWKPAISNDVLILKHNTSDTYIFSYNTNNPRFAAYTSSQGKPSFYKWTSNISYSNFITTCKDVKSIAVQTAPTKVDYTEEETLDLTGLVVRVTYDDDSYLDITSGFTTDPANGAMLTNETKVTITYKEKTCDQAITITPLPRKTINATAPDGGTYTVKVGDGEAQTISAATTITDVIAGRTITMTSTADDQHQLPSSDPFVVKDESDADVKVNKSGNNYSFTMPESNVTITARYVQTYTITSATGLVGGTVETDKTKTSKNTKVNVTVTPNPGYNIVKVFYLKENDTEENVITFENDKYSFNMPANNVTVSAEFEAIKYTITLNDKDNITLKENLLYNAEVDLPALTPCYGYAFEGWTATEPTTGAWATKPAIVAQVKVTADATFYAVYSQGSEEITNDYVWVSDESEITSGNYLFVSYNADWDEIAMNNNFTAGKGSGDNYQWARFGYTTIVSTDGIISNPNASCIWTIEGDATNGYTIYNAASSKYISIEDEDLAFVTSGAKKFDVKFEDEYYQVIKSRETISNPYISYFEDDDKFEVVSEASYYDYLYKQVINSDITYTAQPECKTLDEIVIMQDPTKTIYKKGETFDKTGMIVYAAFTDKTNADVTAFIEVDETTPLTMTDEKVTVSYTQDGITATADQPIYVVELKDIEVKDAKNNYTEGAFFDMSKLVLNAVYSSTIHDKTLKEVVTSGITVEPNRALTTSDTKVTISYNGKSVDYDITVSETQPFTVKFTAGDDEYEVTETGKSAGVFVPSVTNCGDYTFVGWSKDLIDEASSCDLVTITEGKYYPEEDVELYAVYKYASNPTQYRQATSLDELTDGKKVVIYSPSGSQIAYANGTAIMAYELTESNGILDVNGYDAAVWTIVKNNDQYQFKQGTKYLGMNTVPTSNNSSSNLNYNTSNYTWSITAKGTTEGNYTFFITQPTNVYLEYYSGWKGYRTTSTSTYALQNRIYVQAGSTAYTTIPDCDVEIEIYKVDLYAGSGKIGTEDMVEYMVLKGDELTLPTPTLDAGYTDWSFAGWTGDAVLREVTVAPSFVTSVSPTADIEYNAVYSRPVGNGNVYKTYPSALQRPSFSPEVGTYDEAKDVTITAGEGATIYYRKTTDELHHVMNSEYTAKVDEAAQYTAAIKTATTTFIVAVAQYGDKFSDEEMYKIDYNYPDAPTFSAETGSNIFMGQSVTITAPEGTLLRYQINSADVVELTTNTYTHTFNNVVENITLKAYSEKGGLKSAEVSATYHIKPVPNKVTFHAGTGLIDGESTKEIYEDAAGQGLILPILDAPCTNGDSWKFYGWAKATVAATTSTPTILKEGDSDCSYTAQGLRFYPTSDCELYAVYTKTTGIVELINEDFAEFNTTSGSDNFPTVDKVYDVVPTTHSIRLGASGGTGSITSKALLVPVGSTLNIQFDYKAWAYDKYANIKISEASNNVTYVGSGYTEFTHVAQTLITTIDNPQITIATTYNNDNRAYIANLVITMGTPVQNYATNPECCVHTINFSTTGEAIEPVAIPCGTGNFIALPEAKKQNCNFIKWTLNTDEYSAGDIYAYDYNRTDDVTFTAVFTEPLTSVTVENGEIRYASELPYNYNGDLCVKDGGIFVADIALTVNNFVIEVGQGHAGQVKAAKNLTIHGDAYMQLEIDPADAASPGWYAFGVPFPVDALNGVYYNDTKLTNEVGYAIMDYHGDVRAQGQYGWKKYRGILQPGVFYYLTVGDTDYKTLRFHLKKDGDYTIENAASKWESDQLKSEKCRTNFYPFATSGDGQVTDKGWNGVANKALEDVTVSTNTSMSNYVYTYNNSVKTFEIQDLGESPTPVFSPATPFFVVSTANEEKSFSANFQPLPAANEAPRFAPMVQAFSKVKVTLSNNAYTDKYYVSASEDAKNEYKLGLDAVKMGTIDNNTKVPQIVSVNYNNTLLSAEYAQLVNGQATISLLLYAPADGEYTIAATECKDGTIYLTQNGVDIWNLKDAYTLTLNKGKVFEYGLHLVVDSGQAPTNINGLNGNSKAQKIFKDYNIYILRDAKLYNAQGTELK